MNVCFYPKCINACIEEEEILLTTIKDILGYSGRTTMRLLPSVILLFSFLIPLSISLHASINSPFYSEEDYFGIFPSDPFPSNTICFTNSSTVIQEAMWGNLTTSFTPTCNVTFTAQPCNPQVKERTEIILSCFLVFMSLGLAIVLVIANPQYLIRLIVATVLCCIVAGVIAALIFNPISMHEVTTRKNMVLKSCGADDDDISDFDTIVEEDPWCVRGVILSPGFLFNRILHGMALIFCMFVVGFICLCCRACCR